MAEHGYCEDWLPNDATDLGVFAVLEANISSPGYRKYSTHSLQLEFSANALSGFYIDVWGLISAWSTTLSCSANYVT